MVVSVLGSNFYPPKSQYLSISPHLCTCYLRPRIKETKIVELMQEKYREEVMVSINFFWI